jgi:3-phenylpropionate/trans-cinnamate dioxygenase ferredoxin reductase component
MHDVKGGGGQDGVVIAGGGLAAQRCAEALRRLGYEGRVRVVCGESHLPYDRPPLSKQVLGDPAAEDTVAFRAPEWYEDKGIELLRGVGASGLAVTAHRLELADGSALHYEQLVIATGSRPRMLPAFARYENVSTLRTLEDSRALRELLEARSRLLIIGAGFIGQEVAAAARGAGVEVTVVEAEPLPLHGLLGREIGTWFARLHRGEGVDLVLGHTAAQIHGDGRVEAVTLDDGRRIDADHVLVAIGVVPDLDWVAADGLPAGGIPTDEEGRSEFADVYAAGDAAAFYDAFLERHELSGHWESAGRQGAAVANAIVGRPPGTPGLSSFWSDQYGVRIQYLGHAHLAERVAVEGDPEARDFVAVYTRAGQAVAALIVGRPKALPELRDRLRYITERTAV